MATTYLTRARLVQLIGSRTVEDAELDGTVDVQATIEAQCAVADGYVGAQVRLPPSPAAVEQVAPIVAELVYCALLANAGSDAVAERRKAAIKQLQDISARPPRLVLDNPPLPDDPNTPEDEGATLWVGSNGRLFAPRPPETW